MRRPTCCTRPVELVIARTAKMFSEMTFGRCSRGVEMPHISCRTGVYAWKCFGRTLRILPLSLELRDLAYLPVSGLLSPSAKVVCLPLGQSVPYADALVCSWASASQF
eukprot:6186622-Pleurochrysis_carterae.AAC.3